LSHCYMYHSRRGGCSRQRAGSSTRRRASSLSTAGSHDPWRTLCGAHVTTHRQT
jgi:hypothetical protein